MFGPCWLHFGPHVWSIWATLASKMERRDSRQGVKKQFLLPNRPKSRPMAPTGPPNDPPRLPKWSPKAPKTIPKPQKMRPQGAVGFSARSPVRSCVRCWVGLVGCASGVSAAPPGSACQITMPSSCQVLGPTLGPTLGVMSLDAPAQFFRVFVVFVPLQKSSPAPPRPTSPPLKVSSEFLFKRPKNVFRK